MDISQLKVGETFKFYGKEFKVCFADICDTEKNKKTCYFYDDYVCVSLQSDGKIPQCKCSKRQDGNDVCFRKVKKESK